MPGKKSKGPTTGSAITEHDGHKFKKMDDNEVLQVTPLGRDLAVVSISKYQGKTSLDLRRFYLSSDSEEWSPTSKGMRIPADSVEDFLTALEAAVPEINARLGE